MKYLSIDIETSGLDPQVNQILSVAAIFEDTEKKLPWDEIPKFHVGIVRHQITGSPRALTMNAKLIEWMGRWIEPKDVTDAYFAAQESGMDWLEEDKVVSAFYNFLLKCGLGEEEIRVAEGGPEYVLNSKTKPITINVAGKNFGTFDKKFLEMLPWWQKAIRVRQRILDPGILFVDWKNDEAVPGLDKCKDRAGIYGLVTHNALEDAWDVVELLRKHY